MTKVLTAITVSISAVLIRGQMAYLKRNGFDVFVCSSDGPEVREIAASEGFELFPVEMAREPKLWRDLIALWEVLRVLRTVRPNIVNAGTAKAGFLFMIASFIVRTPVRIYHVRGFRHESMSGLPRHFQIFIEWICGYLATHIICLTPSVRELGLELRVFPSEKCHVLGPGSSGIELDRYDPSRFSTEDDLRLRKELGIESDALVLGFVGRLVPRKGIQELIHAWCQLREDYPKLRLLLVGPEEVAQPLPVDVHSVMVSDPRIICVGSVSDPAPYYSIMDVFTLPAHWEGFGNVLVEAAAMGKPVVSTNGTGTRDAVSDGFNGLLVPIRDSAALDDAIRRYLDTSVLREEHGENGKKWAQRFSRQATLRFLRDFYVEILEGK